MARARGAAGERRRYGRLEYLTLLTPAQWQRVAAHYEETLATAAHWARRYGVAQEAEDAALDALCRAARTWDPDRIAFPGWVAVCLATSLRNTATRRHDWLGLLARAAAARPGGDRRHNNEDILAPRGEAYVDDQDEGRAAALLRAVPPRCRIALSRCYADGTPVGEVAATLGVSRTTVGNWLREGKAEARAWAARR